MAVFALQRQSWIVSTETVPVKPKLFAISPITRNVHSHLVQTNFIYIYKSTGVFRRSIIQGQRVSSKDSVRPTLHLQPASQKSFALIWWTGRPGVLRFMGSQRVGHDWATELNWTEGSLDIFVCLHKSILKRSQTLIIIGIWIKSRQRKM